MQKRNIYNNYYTGSGTGYECDLQQAPHKYVAKASKVSSIKAKNCPKLSSKYWTYSSKLRQTDYFEATIRKSNEA